MPCIDLFDSPFRRINMPYCLHKMEVEVPDRLRRYPHIWLPLNRNYKPLGVIPRDWVEYEDYVGQAVCFAKDPRGFVGLWDDDPSNVGVDDMRWFHCANPRDWSGYLIKVGKLFAHRHRYFADEK
jgi:hypothetical protein